MPLHPLLLALVALLPAGATWWTGEQVLRRIDDPALPDLLMRRRGRLGLLWGLSLVTIVALDQRHAAWAIPLMFGAMLAAAFPAQRVLLDERWGIGSYLWHSTRRLVGGLAFWVVLLLAPSVVMETRDSRLAALLAAALAAGLLLWLHHYRRFWLWMHAATPLGARPALDERFAAVMARATTTPPLLFRFGQPGERRAAAFAFPSAGQAGAVVFSDALLELLTAEETAAVFAHEVAHLEHYTPRRMRRMRLAASLLVVALLSVSVVAQRAAPVHHLAYTLAGALVVLLALGVRASRSRGHETASDLRGAELCGDAEALVRALTKLHTALRLPRRWSADVERTATHPSLVHRIAALRAAAAASEATDAGEDVPGDAPARMARFAPLLLRSTRGGACVVMEATRIHILDAVPDDALASAADVAALAARAADCRTLAYERLTRLALEDDGARRGARLVVAERGGGRWSVPLSSDDADRARVAIDIVDVRVGTSASPADTSRRAGPVLVVGAAVVALLLASQLGVLLLLAAGALFLPVAATLGGFGAATLVRATVALAAGETTSRAPLLVAALLGVAALALAWRQSRAAQDAGGARSLHGALVALGVLATVYGAAAAWVAAKVAPVEAIAPLCTCAALAAALAAATALRPELGRRRWLAAPAAAAALAVPLAARLLDRAAASPPLDWRTAPASIVSSAPVSEMARDLVVAPGGVNYVVRAFQSYAGEEDAEDGEYQDGHPERPHLVLGALDVGVVYPHTIGGHAAAFVADDSLLLLATRREAEGLELRLSHLTASPRGPAVDAPSWRLTLPEILSPELRLDAARRRWSVTGRLPEAVRTVATLEGRVGDTAFVRRVWPRPATAGRDAGYAAVTPLADGSALGVRIDGDYRAALVLSLLGAAPWTTELSRIDGARVRRLALLSGFARCVAGRPGTAGDPAAACVLMGRGGSSRVVVVSAAGGVQSLATLDEPAGTLALSSDGRVALAGAGRRELLLLDPAHRAATRLALPTEVLTVTDVQWTAAGDVAVVGYGSKGTTVMRVR